MGIQDWLVNENPRGVAAATWKHSSRELELILPPPDERTSPVTMIKTSTNRRLPFISLTALSQAVPSNITLIQR
jgi:hypothetical protein